MTFGIDIFKNIPLLLVRNQPIFVAHPSARLQNKGIVEVIFRSGTENRGYWNGMLGFTHAEVTDPERVERRQDMRGWYGKGGYEWVLGGRKARSNFGVRGVATYSRYTNTLLFEGPAFGDYRGVDVVDNVGLGFEPYYALDFSLGSNWMLRWETRWSHHTRILGSGFTPYYPGVGVSFGLYDYIVSAGTTLQLHYRFQR